MRRVKTAVFYAALRLAVVFALLTMWTALPRGGAGMRAAPALYSRFTRFLLKTLCGVSVRCEGLEKLPAGPCILACKHQTEWDPFALMELVRRDTAFIMKKELFKIPLWGFYARAAGSVSIDRAAGAGALRSMVRNADAALKNGLSVVIFPEGTRTRPGRKCVRYHPGVAALYKHLDAPAAPVALNSGQFWPRLRGPARAGRSGEIVIRVLDPIEPGLDSAAFMARLHSAVETESLKLVEAAGGLGAEDAALAAAEDAKAGAGARAEAGAP